MIKKTVLRVHINCIKCKKEVLRIVSKLEGINNLSVDGEKGTLTVIGDVDPVVVVKKLRKAGKFADIVSVGPPKANEEEKKPKLEPRIQSLPTCCSCRQCEPVAIVYPQYDQPCSIL